MAIQFKYTTAITKIRQMKARIKIIPGGSSAGKTLAILAILIDKCAREPGLSVSVVSESMPHLRRGAMRDFLNVMKATGRYRDNNWNRSNSIYHFTNGSYIEFFGVEDADKLRGARRNVLYMNEVNNIPEDAYTQLAMRTDKDIYLDYNPSHHFWIDNVKNGDESEELILTYKHNEALPQSVIKFLEDKRILAETSEYWANWCRVYLDGQQGRLDGVVFGDWDEVECIPSNAELIASGIDFGYTNDPSTLISVYKMDNELYLDEVIYKRGLTNSDLSYLIKQHGIKGMLIADSAEPKSIEELRRLGHSIQPAKKGPDSILNGIQILQQYKIHITKRSGNLKSELEGYTWKKDINGNSLNQPIGPDHCLDAVRYVGLNKLASKGKPSFEFITI